MKKRITTAVASLLVAMPITLSDNSISTASADTDTDFATTLHGFGIYGPRDYNAWLAKITCKRVSTGVDANATDSAAFLAKNLPRTASTQQVWQFMGTAFQMYCPENLGTLTALAGNHTE